MLYQSAGWLNILTVLAFGVLVDADHYLWHIMKFRTFSITKAFKYFLNAETAHHIVLPLHWVEWFIPLMIGALYFEIFWYALLGFSVHMALDLIQLKFLKPDGRNLSLVGWWVKQ